MPVKAYRRSMETSKTSYIMKPVLSVKAARVLIVFAGLMLLSFSAFAQRQTPGRPSVEGWAGFGPVAGRFLPAGGTLTWNKHDYVGRMSFGLDVDRVGMDVTTELTGEDGVTVTGTASCGAWQVQALGGYMARLFATRSRSVILSGGGYLCTGVKYVPDIERAGYILGLVPELQGEVFLGYSVSLFASFRPKFIVVDTIKGRPWFQSRVGVGVKFYL